MTTPAPAELVHQVAVAPVGGDMVCAADIDGDGMDEVIICDRYHAWVFYSQLQ